VSVFGDNREDVRQPLPVSEHLEADPRWQLTQRIISSEHLRKSHRLRDFLLYVVEKSLQNRASEITEQQIGVHVFGRKPDYNASEENVVRSQARLLRLKLESYFAHEGLEEDLLLTIPRGTYVPTFTRRPKEIRREAEPEIGVGVGVGAKAINRRFIVGISVLALGMVGAAAILRSRPTSPLEEEWSRDSFWRKVFTHNAGDEGVLVVPADASFGLIQEILSRRVTLPEFLSRSYVPEWESAAKRTGILADLPARNYTVHDSAMNISRIFRIGTRMDVGLKLRSARDVGYRDLRLASAILLGTARDNPWMELVEPKLPMYPAWDYKSNQPMFVNRNPRPGERAAYRPESYGDGRKDGSIQYAHIAWLPNDSRTGSILVIGGTDSPAAEWTGDMLSDANLFRNLLVPRLREASAGLKTRELPYFQVLVQTREAEGRSLDLSIIAVRCWE
jgi:hypothetical protein